MSKGKNKGKRRSPVVVAAAATPPKPSFNTSNGITPPKASTSCGNCEDSSTALKDCNFCKVGFCVDNTNCSKACANPGCEKTPCVKCAVGCKDCDVSSCRDCSDNLMVTGHCGETWCAFCGAKESTDEDCARCTSSERDVRQARAGHLIAGAVTRSTFQRLSKERPLRSASENQEAAQAESKSILQLMDLPGLPKSEGDLDELEDIEDDDDAAKKKKKKTKPSNSSSTPTTTTANGATSAASSPNPLLPALSAQEMARRRADMSANELLEAEAREKREQEEVAKTKRLRKRDRKNKLKQQKKTDDERVQDILASESAQAFGKSASATGDDVPSEESDSESDDEDDEDEDDEEEEEEDKNKTSGNFKENGSDGKGNEGAKAKEAEKAPAAPAVPLDAAGISAAGMLAGEIAAREAAEGIRIEDWEDPESAYFKKLLGPYLWGNLFKDNNTGTMAELLVLEDSPVDLPRWGVMLGRIQAQAKRDAAKEDEDPTDDNSDSSSSSATASGDTSASSSASSAAAKAKADANSAEAAAAVAVAAATAKAEAEKKAVLAEQAKVAAAEAKAAAAEAKIAAAKAKEVKAKAAAEKKVKDDLAAAEKKKRLREEKARLKVEADAKMLADAEAKAKADAERKVRAKAKADLAKLAKAEAREKLAIQEAAKLKAQQEAITAAAERRALKKQQKKQDKLDKKAAEAKSLAEMQAQQRFLSGGAGGDADMLEAFRVAEEKEKREAVIAAREREELAKRREQATRAEGITMTNMGDVTVKTGAFHTDLTPEQLLKRAIDQSHAFDYDAYGALDGDMEDLAEEESRIINNLEKSLKTAHAANSKLRRQAQRCLDRHLSMRDDRIDQVRRAVRKDNKRERKAATKAAKAAEAAAAAASGAYAAGAGAGYDEELVGAVDSDLQQVAARVWGQLGGDVNRQQKESMIEENRNLHARVRDRQEHERDVKAARDEIRGREQVEMQRQRELELQMTPDDILNQPIIRDWENKECFFWFEKGSCRFGDKCHFSHERLDRASEGTTSGTSTPRYGTTPRGQQRASPRTSPRASPRASPAAPPVAVRSPTLAVLQRPTLQQQANAPVTGTGAAAGAGGLVINTNGASAMPRLAIAPKATAQPFVPASVQQQQAKPSASAVGVEKVSPAAGGGKHIPAGLRAECVQVMSTTGISNADMNHIMRKLKKMVGDETVNGAKTLKGLLPKTEMVHMDKFLIKKTVDHVKRLSVCMYLLGTDN